MNNKHRKEKTMRKMAIVIGILSVLATSAHAGYWKITPYSDGSWSVYSPERPINRMGSIY